MANTQEDKTAIGVLSIITLILWIPSMIWAAYATQILWGWFATPQLGLATPSIPVIMGLGLLIRMLIGGWSRHYHDERPMTERLQTGISMMITAPAIAILMGWVILHFV